MIKFTTESGSIYTIDTQNKKWYRNYNPSSTHVRGTTGDYIIITKNIMVGQPVVIIGLPIVEDSQARVITTSKVIKYQIE
jgi:hypothetical protein